MNLFRLKNGNSTNHKFNQRAVVLIPLVLTCFALSPTTQAVSPAPDGGYAGNNTAEGFNALFSLTTGTFNAATGTNALFSNTMGNGNTATGGVALRSNTTGSGNTATGGGALFSNMTGSGNTADGVVALAKNTADGNTAVGSGALDANTSGGSNIALGSGAGDNLTTGDDNIDIGNGGVAAESATIRIGSADQTKTFIAGISGVMEGGTGIAAVTINSSGQLGTQAVAVSSRRFKQEIKPMDKASDAILALKPVTFRYKKELDPQGNPQFGLIAEEVEKVNPALITRDADGKPYSVRYDAVNAMLLNEFLKEHRAFLKEQRKVQQQEATIAELKKEVGTVVTRLKEQAAQIQKVSAQLEVSKPAPQTVLNNQ